MNPDCTLIISIYNQARQMELLLESILRQTHKSLEIIIADDGSSDNAREKIEVFKQENPHLPIKHVWHEDQGFRKTVILNKGVKVAQSAYLIFVDGDMLLHPRFVEMHLKYAHPKRTLCGWRGVKIGGEYTKQLMDGKLKFDPCTINILWHGLKGGIDNAFRTTIVENKFLRSILFKERGYVGGCNFSIHKSNYERVNGMDESILQYGYEDIEIGHRLQLNDIQPVGIRNCANTYHLHHRKSPNPGITEIKKRIYQSQHKRCRYGLIELKEGSCNDMFLGKMDF